MNTCESEKEVVASVPDDMIEYSNPLAYYCNNMPIDLLETIMEHYINIHENKYTL